MRVIKVSEASGVVLDWLVAKCEGVNEETFSLYYTPAEPSDLDKHGYPEFHYSSVWAQGGPIIERERIYVYPHPDHVTWLAALKGAAFNAESHTPLIAAMRCFCCSKLGDIVEVPEELCQQQSS